MRITKGQILTTKDLIKELGVNRNKWDRNKEEILMQLGKTIPYQRNYKGRSVTYEFLESGEFVYEHQRTERLTQRDELLEQAIDEILAIQPINTAANVTRIIMSEWHEIVELGYTEGTIYEYVRVRIKNWLGASEKDLGDFKNMTKRKGYIEKKEWCYLDLPNNNYIPLTQEQVSEFYAMVRLGYEIIFECDIRKMGDVDAGTLSQAEANKDMNQLRIDNFIRAKKMFHDKFGFYPVLVPHYHLYKFDKQLEH